MVICGLLTVFLRVTDADITISYKLWKNSSQYEDTDGAENHLRMIQTQIISTLRIMWTLSFMVMSNHYFFYYDKNN